MQVSAANKRGRRRKRRRIKRVGLERDCSPSFSFRLHPRAFVLPRSLEGNMRNKFIFVSSRNLRLLGV